MENKEHLKKFTLRVVKAGSFSGSCNRAGNSYAGDGRVNISPNFWTVTTSPLILLGLYRL